MSGTSVGRMTRRICSIDERSGDNPPCMVKIFSSIIAAIGRQLKQSVKVFHNLILYLRLPDVNSIWDRNTFIIESVDPVNTGALVVSS